FFKVKDKWQKKGFLKPLKNREEKPTEGLGFSTNGGGFITLVDGSEDVFLSSISTPMRSGVGGGCDTKSKKENPL
ncbi:UNVERIFIED_CONTAM: hypothetical protein Sindi_0466200, partial [Sesamum indicum]